MKDATETYAEPTLEKGSVSEKTDTADADNVRLAELGYKSEFKREFSLIETIAFSFSIMAVLTLTNNGTKGGHVGLIFGWLIPCIPVMCVAASMAELASSMPTSAGLYYFSAKLAPEKYSALASWITGWANITGQVTLVCGIDFTVAQMIATAVAVGTDNAVILGSGPSYAILLAILFCHGLICSAATKILAKLNLFYAVLNVMLKRTVHIAGTTLAAIISLLVCSGDNRVSTEVAFTAFENHTGWKDDGWAFLLAFVVPMWQFTGYDSAAHISEEITGAARAAPIAILVSVFSVAVLGWIYTIATSFAIASVPDLLATDLALPMGQLYLDVIGKKGMMTLWCLTITFLCGAAQGVDASRVVFAFARDGALPGSRWWRKVSRRTQTPVNAVWLVMGLSAICGLLGFSATALTSLASASVIGMYVSYTTPIFLRITSGRHKLIPGPFSLGKWFIPVGAVAVIWVVFIVVLLCFPTSQTADSQNMNYAVVIIMAVFIFASASWVLSARKWFVGPLPNIDERSMVMSMEVVKRD
ncbi:APC amino acid permease [Wolfiporia cocos MD-104 SS10]|uniref:APC amino acid permease n=1 Tax=Wolfiporia cocos (strain MD-104) TaxID=742152 RepID=A0A2H3JWA8_WOLCO|nr:APC amino acid permease [Wolfiporia cocos MD-104 SS10]